MLWCVQIAAGGASPARVDVARRAEDTEATVFTQSNRETENTIFSVALLLCVIPLSLSSSAASASVFDIAVARKASAERGRAPEARALHRCEKRCKADVERKARKGRKENRSVLRLCGLRGLCVQRFVGPVTRKIIVTAEIAEPRVEPTDQREFQWPPERYLEGSQLPPCHLHSPKCSANRYGTVSAVSID